MTLSTDMGAIAGVLERAADLIEPEGAWTRLAAARDANDKFTQPFSRRAVCWCMEGAIAAVTRRVWAATTFENEPAYLFLREFLKPRAPCDFNDAPGRKQYEVVAKLRKAAAKARAHD